MRRAAPVREKGREGVRRERFFAETELWLQDDAFEATEEVVKAVAADVGGRDEASVGVGAGVRFGVWFPTQTEGFELGGSAGYVRGPRGRFKVVLGNSALSSEDQAGFFRLLLEFRRRLPISDRVDFQLRGGVGFARGEVEEDFRTSGPAFIPSSDTFSSSGSGVAWEVGPAVCFKGERVDVSIGVAYAGFPKIKETDDLAEFEWTPFGFRVGVEF